MSSSYSRRLTLTIDGKRYQVEIDDVSTSPVRVLVNGVLHEVSLERAPARAQAPSTATSSVAPEAAAPPSSPASPIAKSTSEIRAPMPGNILDILVQPGDAVDVGQQLCSLEAMKMKSAIRSNRQGVVATVEVTQGQAVSHGDVLLTFE